MNALFRLFPALAVTGWLLYIVYGTSLVRNSTGQVRNQRLFLLIVTSVVIVIGMYWLGELIANTTY